MRPVGIGAAERVATQSRGGSTRARADGQTNAALAHVIADPVEHRRLGNACARGRRSSSAFGVNIVDMHGQFDAAVMHARDSVGADVVTLGPRPMPHNFDEADAHESRPQWLANSWLKNDIARNNAQQLGELATECSELVAFGCYRIRIANTHISDEPEFASCDINDLHADFELEGDLRHFEAVYDSPGGAAGAPSARVTLAVMLVKVPERKIVAQTIISARQPAAANATPAIVEAMNQATGSVAKQVVAWTLSNPALSTPRR